MPCLIGLATAYSDAIPLQFWSACLSVLGALLAHAGINVLNDYYDSRNGGDGLNTDRLFPFTGGSRFIQNGVLSEAQTARYGYLLLFATLAIGLAGLFIGWAYSARPLALNSHGLGEPSAAVGFGLLIVVGCDLVQRGELSWLPVWASLPYGLLVTALLCINQFPDRRVDAQVGKRHWVVRLGTERARWGYLAMVVAAYALLSLLVAVGALPAAALLALLPLPLSLKAARDLVRYAGKPERLIPAIPLTIAAMSLHALLLALGLTLSHTVRSAGEHGHWIWPVGRPLVPCARLGPRSLAKRPTRVGSGRRGFLRAAACGIDRESSPRGRPAPGCVDRGSLR